MGYFDCYESWVKDHALKYLIRFINGVSFLDANEEALK